MDTATRFVSDEPQCPDCCCLVRAVCECTKQSLRTIFSFFHFFIFSLGVACRSIAIALQAFGYGSVVGGGHWNSAGDIVDDEASDYTTATGAYGFIGAG